MLYAILLLQTEKNSMEQSTFEQRTGKAEKKFLLDWAHAQKGSSEIT